jgi:hypothetical protein
MMMELFRACRAGEKDAEARLLAALKEVTGTREGFQPIEIVLLEQAAVRLPKRFRVLFADVRQQCPDVIVRALANLIVEVLQPEVVTDRMEGFGPSEDVEVVAVDERTVDIEQNSFRHGRTNGRECHEVACDLPAAPASVILLVGSEEG